MQKTPTTSIWTSGITNVPLNDRDSRYTFFELDTKDIDKLHFVLDVYRENLETCYVHELISGYHFFNLIPIEKERYYRIIKLMKFLNPLCPLTVLRLTPNKWRNEESYWNKGTIIGQSDELIKLRFAIETQNIAYLKERYEVVRYPFEECPKCKKSININWSYELGCFMCRTCNKQTIGRVKQRNPEDRIIDRRKYSWEF
jgi:hypothetical protein